MDFTGTDNGETINGTAGDDRIYAGGGNDTVTAGGGNDEVYGGEGDDSLDGGDGDDLLDGGLGVDTMVGGTGDDTYVVDDAGDVVTELLNGGTDMVRSALEVYQLGDHVENLTFADGLFQVAGTGNALDNAITANAAAYALLDGQDGDDTLDASAVTSSASLYGGTDDDTLYGGVNTDGYTDENGNFHQSGDYIDGGEGDDVIVAGGGLDQLYGGDGDDRITGSDDGFASYYNGDGNLVSGAGDSIGGGAGADVIMAGGGEDYVDGGADDDEIHGGGGADALYAGSGADTVYGDEGEDSIGAFDDSGPADSLYGGDGNDAIFASSAGSQVYGGVGNDFLYTYGGNGSSWYGGDDGDTFYNLIGNGGADTMSGGAGSDTFRVTYDVSNPAEDVITDFTPGSNADHDRLDISDLLNRFSNYHYGDNPFHDGHLRFVQDGDDALLQGNMNADGQDDSWFTFVRLSDVPVTGIEMENLYPDFARNDVTTTVTINASENGDYLRGTAENDTVNANGGDDIVIAAFGDDAVYGGIGTDRIDGSDGEDTLYGGDGDDIFGDEPLSTTGGGVESLTFGAAALVIAPPPPSAPTDTGINLADYRDAYLHGDFADGDVDTFYGGAGADVYHLNIGQYGIVDVIADFNVAEDVMTLGNLQNLGYWSDGTNPFQTGTMAVVQNGADTLVQLNDNSLLRLLNVQASTLTAANFNGFNPNGAPNVVTGTDGAETLYGTSAADDISGLGGGDTIYAYGGADTVDAGSGGDTVYGGNGADTINGGAGADQAFGDNSNDTVEGGTGDDRLYGGDGDDIVYGGNDGVYVPVGDNGLPAYFGALNHNLINGLGGDASFGEANIGRNDKDARKIEQLRAGVMPIYEPGLGELVVRNVEAGRLSFTTDLAGSVKDADAVFLCVGTPSRRADGHADLSHVYAAAEEIGRALTGFTVIVTKSTVPVGTGDEVERIVREANPDADFAVASNPEFLREGAAIYDFKHPDRIVIGADDPRALEVMRQVYRPLYLNKSPILHMSRRAAELTKYAGNAFLATKITFINEIADLCEKVGADVKDVARGIGLDGRIGDKFLHAGPGYGGSCFPKDTLALLKTAQDHEAPQRIVEAVVAVNDNRKRAMGRKVIAAMGGDVRGKTVAILGLTFKPNTDDMRDSPAIAVIRALQDAGATVRAYDPKGHEQARTVLDDVVYCDGAYHAMEGADALAILTEWDAFRALDFKRIKSLLSAPILVDLRNVYSRDTVEAEGFSYTAVGR